jgi:hypothetical protein
MSVAPRVSLSRGRFVFALAAGLAVVVSSPFAGELRRWIRLQFPGHVVAIVGGAVTLTAIVAIGVALREIRDRRIARYGLIVVAGAIAVAYARWSALGIPDSDAVERVHFIEYGAIAWLFYRAWLPIGGGSILPLAFLSALTVGTFEEWFQWFIPARVGEVRDVFLNAVAIVCGLIVSLAVRPPGPLAALRAGSLAPLAMTAAIALAVLSGFVDAVHVGYEIRDAGAGTFRSIYSAQALDAQGVERQARWTASPPLVRPSPISREDQYASEGLLHVQARNQAWAAGEFTTAWHENLILERYFAPVLDASSYVSRTGHRWPPVQRADAERRSRAGSEAAASTFVSRAQGEFPIFTWSKALFRTLTYGGALVIAGAGMVLGRRERRSARPSAHGL